VKARGGDDLPEDVCGGLSEALKLNWSAEKRLIILIADAPCHGKMFHQLGDSYPDGDPGGLEPEVLISEIFGKGIELFFSQITLYTDIMLKEWRKMVERFLPGKEIRSFNMNSTNQFLPLIADAIGTVLTE